VSGAFFNFLNGEVLKSLFTLERTKFIENLIQVHKSPFLSLNDFCVADVADVAMWLPGAGKMLVKGDQLVVIR
jgi:hypothetical protein